MEGCAILHNEFQDLMSGLGRDQSLDTSISVAVSGGADSMALALLLKDWTQKRRIQLTALIVNHGLRGESFTEALGVATQLRRYGIRSHILTWRKTAVMHTGIQEKARDARYNLMLSWCKKHGVKQLYLGHHQDDQVETFLQALGRGAGVNGLAAMRPLSVRDDCTLVRPLLSVAKARLIATLKSLDVAWVEDPSNQDAKYTRSRLRKAMPILAELGLRPIQISQSIEKLAAARFLMDRLADAFFAEHAHIYPEGYMAVGREEFLNLEKEIALQCLRTAVQKMGGGTPAPRRNSLEKIYQMLRNKQESKGRKFQVSLGGCVLFTQGSTIVIAREVRNLERIEINGSCLVWDQRFEINLLENIKIEKLSIAALGAEGWSELKRRKQVPADWNLPYLVTISLPAIYTLDGLLVAPHIPPKSGTRFKELSVRFLPKFH